MSPGWNLFNSQDSRIASQAGISTGRQRAEPPPLDYSHAATGSPVLGVNLPKTAGQKHKKYPRFQVEIGGVSFHLFPQVAGGFAFLPYAATLCGTQRMEIRCFKKPFGYSHSITIHDAVRRDLGFYQLSEPFPRGSGGSVPVGGLQNGCTSEGSENAASRRAATPLFASA